jgi:hypothetical protein
MEKTYDYDPMIYDVMRESAIRLGGEYIALARKSADPQQKRALLLADRGIQEEARGVDSHDVDAVKAKTREFGRRLKDLHPAAALA